jgi:hypothetical protein
MKSYLIILILVLCFTCWLGDAGMPPNLQGMGINQVSSTPYGATHQENMIPDFAFVDQKRNSPYITKIEDNSNGHEAEFPIGIR